MTKIKRINDDFWDFVEKYNPDFPENRDFLRQAKLQNYIDGNQSPVAEEGLTIDEAEDELHHILYNLLDKAIDNYTKGIGVECDECNSHHTKYCPCCGRLTNNDVNRCNECGSKQIQELAWVDTNIRVIKDDFPVDECDRYCKCCDKHTSQIKESELMEIIDSWHDQLDVKTIETITKLKYDSFSSELDPYAAFIEAWEAFWNALNIEQKIEFWKQDTCDMEDE